MKPAEVRTVFIIDDDRGMRQAIQDLVESVDLRAECFTTGEEFLRKQRTADPCCLVGGGRSCALRRNTTMR